MLEKRRPRPLMDVMAYMMFCLPSTLVFNTRKMCWKLSVATKDCKKTDHNQQYAQHLKRSVREVCLRVVPLTPIMSLAGNQRELQYGETTLRFCVSRKRAKPAVLKSYSTSTLGTLARP